MALHVYICKRTVRHLHCISMHFAKAWYDIRYLYSHLYNMHTYAIFPSISGHTTLERIVAWCCMTAWYSGNNRQCSDIEVFQASQLTDFPHSSPRWTRKKPAKPKRNKAAKQRPILTEFLSDQVKTCCSKNGWCNAMYCLSLKVVIFCECVLLQNCKPTPAKHRNTIHSACKVARIRRQTHAQGQSACYASPAFRQQNPKSVDPSCYGQWVVTISGPSPSDPNLKIASCCWRTRYQVLQSVFLDLSCTPTKKHISSYCN